MRKSIIGAICACLAVVTFNADAASDLNTCDGSNQYDNPLGNTIVTDVNCINDGSNEVVNIIGGDAPFENHGVITNSDSMNLINNGYLFNSNYLTNLGTLTNMNNLFNVHIDSVLENFNSIENNGNIIIFSGQLINRSSGTINNWNYIENADSLENYGAIKVHDGYLGNAGGTIDNHGLLENSGKIDNSGSLTNWETGTISNNGTWDNWSTITNKGIFINNDVLRSSHGLLVNDGFFQNNNSLTLIGDHSNTFINNGTLENHGRLENNGWRANLINNNVLINGEYGTLINNGLLTNESTLTNRGQLTNIWTLTNVDTLVNGGTLTNKGELENRGLIVNNNTFINDGGIISNSGEINGLGTFHQTGGLYSGGQLNNNGMISFYAVNIDSGSLTGTGVINGNTTIGNEGTLRPGDTVIIEPEFSWSSVYALGEMSFKGDLNLLEGSTTIVDIGGLIPGVEFDFLDISGTATLDGTFSANLFDATNDGIENGFMPEIGDSFDIMSADIILGEFDQLSSILVGDDKGWKLSYILDEYGKDYVRLSVIHAVPAPSAVWLFGSGLLGLIGVARKTA